MKLISIFRLCLIISFLLIPVYSMGLDMGVPDSPSSGIFNVQLADPVDSNSGSANMSIPIEVPPGRKGIAPNLALKYSSMGGSGIVGGGWLLDMGAIQRNTKRGLNYSANDFVFIKDGSAAELVPRGDWHSPTSSNCYGNKIESGFNRYCYNSSTGGWEAAAKNGTKFFYGSTPASRRDNQSGVFRWMLDRVEDANGNYMTVTYWKDQGEIYIDRIDYTGNTKGLGASNSVLFTYEARADMPQRYSMGSMVVAAYRLKTIETKAGGQTAKKYILSYNPYDSNSTSTYRSLLTSVVQSGYDGSPLPATTFTYWQNPQFSFNENPSWVKNTCGSYLTEFFIDMDADGLVDRISISYLSISVYMNNGSGGFQDTPSYTKPGQFLGPLYFDNVRFVDVNGDGLIDWIHFKHVQYGLCEDCGAYVYLNNGNGGFQDTPSWYMDGGFNINTGKGQYYYDVNGDGLVDWISLVHDEGFKVYFNNGSGGFHTTPDWQGGLIHENDATRQKFMDMNGDGLGDIVHINTTGGGVVYLNLGTDGNGNWRGFNITPVWGGLGYLGNEPSRQMFADVNGDGLPDWIHISTSGGGIVHLNNGNGGFNDTAIWSGLGYLGSEAERQMFYDVNGDGLPDWVHVSSLSGAIVHLNDGNGGFHATANWWGLGGIGSDYINQRLVDVNGDGLVDWVNACAHDHYFRVFLNIGPDRGILKSIDNGLGATRTINYAPSVIKPDKLFSPFAVQTVSDITVDPGTGSASTTYYSFSGGLYDYVDREPRGFSYVKATYPGGTTNEVWFHQDDIFKGLSYTSITKDPAGYIYTSAYNTFDSVSPYAGVTFPRLIQKDDYVYDGSTSVPQQSCAGNNYCKQAASSFEYDSYGNIIRKYLWGDVSFSGDERDEHIEYTYDAINWIVSLPSHTYVLDSSGATKAQSWFTYSPEGSLLTKEAWLNGGTNPVITYGYDSYGNTMQTAISRHKETRKARR